MATSNQTLSTMFYCNIRAIPFFSCKENSRNRTGPNSLNAAVADEVYYSG